MKNIKKLSALLSLTSLVLLSGCGEVSHHYYSASKSHSQTVISSSSSVISSVSTNPQEPATIFNNGLELFNYTTPNELTINRPEFGDGSYLTVSNPSGETYISGEIHHISFEEKANGISSIILFDINEDGYRELCYTIGSAIRNSVTIYDLEHHERLYYLEPVYLLTPSSYWFSLENNHLVIHRGADITQLNDTNDWGFMLYETSKGVYADWSNHLNIEGLTLNIRDENMDLIRHIRTKDRNFRYSLVMDTYKTYWFCIKPITEAGTWSEVYESSLLKDNIFFAFCSEDVKFRKESDIEHPISDGIDFPLYFAYYDDNQWVQTTTIQILCSGYTLSIDAYFN